VEYNTLYQRCYIKIGGVLMPIMDSLSKIAKSVGDGAKTAVKKSEDMVEIAKLNKSITNEEDRIKLTYNEIGKKVYLKYENNEIIEDELIEFCHKIDEFQNNILSIKQKIAEIKNVKVCSNCGAEIELATEFCVKCGAKQEIVQVEKIEIESKVEFEQPQKDIIDKPKFCPSCGKEIVEDSKFCQECGAKL
jgi:predicted RNA-binding Zn-ribbon protein involved in translation (DUF1610 family)